MDKQLNLSYKLSANGFTVLALDNIKYAVRYPAKIFNRLPKPVKLFFIENFIYSRVRALNLLNWRLNFRFGRPAWQKFIDFGLLKIIPCLAEINNLRVAEILKNFPAVERRGKLVFNGKPASARLVNFKSKKNRAVLALSFGKDSILSYGLAKELGLKLLLVTANEMAGASGDEWKIKSRIIKGFCQEQGEKIHFFSDNVDELYYHPQINCQLSEFNNTNSMLAYALELLPFAYRQRARYLIFGNEQNLNDYYYNKDGYKFYPSFDQSSEYAAKENKLWAKALPDKFQVASLVEPLYNLGEYYILYHRYPHLLKYVMSCEPDKGSAERWCYHCPMCAKTFLYAAAVGGDPKRLAFNRDFFQGRYSELYPMFARKPLRHYERPPQVKEEQLLAFLLVYRLGWRGRLIDLFKQRHLNETLKQEKILRKKYFGLHPAPNLPAALKPKVLKIYRQELANLV